ncbi:unnamed protein product [Protopolystoma xenopodis]|uniref:Uncharacterized protein n=1 Tax=Protopolystoma xenopodis TaxID=117903 RepID=A0A448WVE1_9PLAT|nr:unnamed protein product [Protopolystoma xenopodis]
MRLATPHVAWVRSFKEDSLPFPDRHNSLLHVSTLYFIDTSHSRAVSSQLVSTSNSLLSSAIHDQVSTCIASSTLLLPVPEIHFWSCIVE